MSVLSVSNPSLPPSGPSAPAPSQGGPIARIVNFVGAYFANLRAARAERALEQRDIAEIHKLSADIYNTRQYFLDMGQPLNQKELVEKERKFDNLCSKLGQRHPELVRESMRYAARGPKRRPTYSGASRDDLRQDALQNHHGATMVGSSRTSLGETREEARQEHHGATMVGSSRTSLGETREEARQEHHGATMVGSSRTTRDDLREEARREHGGS